MALEDELSDLAAEEDDDEDLSDFDELSDFEAPSDFDELSDLDELSAFASDFAPSDLGASAELVPPRLSLR